MSSFVRFTRIVAFLHWLCCYIYCYIVALLLQSICVTTAVGKLLVQRPSCVNCLCKLVQTFPLSIKPLPSLHLRVPSVKSLSAGANSNLLLWCPFMFLSWHQESSHGFASNFASGCKQHLTLVSYNLYDVLQCFSVDTQHPGFTVCPWIQPQFCLQLWEWMQIASDISMLQFIWCPSMFLSWHPESSHSFASDFESGCK